MKLNLLSSKTNQSYLVKGCYKEDELKDEIIQKANYVSLDNENHVIAVYLGKREEMDVESLNEAIVSLLECYRALSMEFDVISFTNKAISEENALQIISETIWFVQRRNVCYKAKCDLPERFPDYGLITNIKNAKEILNWSEIKMSSVNMARDLQDTPPNIMTPTYFAKQIETIFAPFKEVVKIKVLDKAAIEKEKMGLLLAVNKASDEEPRVVVVEYCNQHSDQEVLALIGKGITFDTGGYSLKSWDIMEGMKFDMSGAAIACAVMLALCKTKPNKNVVAVCTLTENMIGGHGTVPESVAYAMDGQSVELVDLDAEGRLVMADGICYALKHHKATKIVDLSTLTGSAARALGKWYTCVVCTDEKFYADFSKATAKSFEPIWRMPLGRCHYDLIEDSKIADILNLPKETNGGMSVAAAFLAEFCDKKPFLHLDIAATADDGHRGKGVMVRSLLEYIAK